MSSAVISRAMLACVSVMPNSDVWFFAGSWYGMPAAIDVHHEARVCHCDFKFTPPTQLPHNNPDRHPLNQHGTSRQRKQEQRCVEVVVRPQSRIAERKPRKPEVVIGDDTVSGACKDEQRDSNYCHDDECDGQLLLLEPHVQHATVSVHNFVCKISQLEKATTSQFPALSSGRWRLNHSTAPA